MGELDEITNVKVYKGAVFRPLTYKQIKAILVPEAYKRFNTWMYGQTCPFVDGETGVYPWDFERWLMTGCPEGQRRGDWD